MKVKKNSKPFLNKFFYSKKTIFIAIVLIFIISLIAMIIYKYLVELQEREQEREQEDLKVNLLK